MVAAPAVGSQPRDASLFFILRFSCSLRTTQAYALSIQQGLGMSKTNYLTTKEAAAILKCSTVSIRRMIKAGTLPAFRAQREWRVPLEALRPQRQGGTA